MQPQRATAGFPVLYVAPLPPNLNDIALEQLEFLIEHTQGGFCVNECTLCARLLAAREILFESFRDSASRPN